MVLARAQGSLGTQEVTQRGESQERLTVRNPSTVEKQAETEGGGLRYTSLPLLPPSPLHQHVSFSLSHSPDFTLMYFEKLVKGGEKNGGEGLENWKKKG